eukprot:15364701-Ditylum_brightwellii.AAC.1
MAEEKLNIQVDKAAVCWEANKSAIRFVHLGKQICIIKFQYNWLSIGTQKVKSDKSASAAPTAIAARTAAILKLKSALYDHCMSPSTVACHINSTQLPTDAIGQRLQIAVAGQTSLGWLSFIKGRVSKKWAEAQKHYLDIAAPDLTKHIEERWAYILVPGLWNFFDKIWMTRNAASHGTLFYHATSSTLDADIKILYNTLQHQMSGNDAQLFFTPITEQLKMLNDAKFHWLRAVNMYVKAFANIEQ